MKNYYLSIVATAIIGASSYVQADIHVDIHDLDGDGVITLQEVFDYHPHTSIFNGADANNDGVVDRSESQGDGINSNGGKGKGKS